MLKTVRQANDIFVDQKSHRARCDAFVVAGPGPLKNELAESSHLLPEIRNKIASVVDVGYGGRLGLAEAVRRSRAAIAGARCEREASMVRELFSRIAKDDARYALGPDAMEALNRGCVDTLMVRESNRFRTLICGVKTLPEDSKQTLSHTDLTFVHVHERRVRQTTEALEAQGEQLVLRVVDFTDWVIDHAGSFGAKVEILSTRGPEQVQLEKGFGGVAALTRYAFQPESEMGPAMGATDLDSDDGYSSSSSSDSSSFE